MRKLLLFLFIGVLTLSCSDDDNSPPGPVLSDTPTAKADYDDSNYGIYKGIFVGSSGNVLINIKNNDATITATIVLDGITYNFTTDESVTEDENIVDLTFTSGAFTFDFSVNSDGTDPIVSNINFSGHPDAEISVVKEDSEHLVRCYQGTFTGDSSGTFNFTIIENDLDGLASVNSDEIPYVLYLYGDVTNNTSIMGYVTDGGTFSGTISGNNVSGTWQNDEQDDPENGTWSGTRTL